MRLLSILFLCLGLVFPTDLSAETTSVRGEVVDAAGAPVAGARVVLRADGTTRSTETDHSGRFAFEGVPDGASVTASASGMTRATAPIGEERSYVTLVLQPVATEAITVVAPSDLAAVHTVTAARTDTPLRDVPQSVSVVTRDVIEDQAMQSMADVVQYVPGVQMAQGEGHRDAPILRGNVSTSDFFVDGLRDDVQYLRDLYNVQRVEVLKGPNAMLFGRGGAGGVVNRVLRTAEWSPVREIAAHAGSEGHRRIVADVGEGLSETMAVRVIGMYENSDTFRDDVSIERRGVNPSLALALGENTTVRAGYEYFADRRTVDRGVSSFAGRPLEIDRSTYFGKPGDSHARAEVHAVSASLDHRWSEATSLRSRVSFGDYDKFYQNVVPGATDATATSVSLSAYNNATQRRNMFAQNDLVLTRRTGRVMHTILTGVELGRQVTDNFRNTGYFTSVGEDVKSIMVPLADPRTTLPVTFRQSAKDADNHGVATIAAAYVQDQISISPRLQVVAGLRFDRFAIDFDNNRNGQRLSATDNLVSPRLGVIYKPRDPVSLYASYTLAHEPRAGEQLASLTPSSASLEPEKFENHEIGAKWDISRALHLAIALYRLDRGNVVAPDPLDPRRSILVDAQRSEGLEANLAGNPTRRWTVLAGYAYQDAEITHSLSSSARAGAQLPQVPEHSFSLWNNYDWSEAWSFGVGVIHRTDVFASVDNKVVLPSFTRVDAAASFAITDRLRTQLNVENIFDEHYFASAHSNTNITPGSPRALRLSWIARF